ncbi:MAG: SusC/RagA family TonB-linked outer membrane protein [Sphingobacteriaceae bacterium]|nr:MAG: SusC/RagA family TonB-linked outer membrane protein [Sphingobacteriaceae bacterium]
MKKLVLSLFILCTLTVAAFAQERTVTGTVKASEDGLPIPGASVKVKEAPTVGTTTGTDGKFSLKVPANGRTLQISYLGYSTQEVAISGNMVNTSLVLDAKTLDQVVVTAGGVNIKRREQGNQSTTIRSQELTQAKAFNVATALTGKVAGLQVNAVSSGLNPNVRLVLRGNRSILGNNQALVVLDNVIVPNNILGNLNPEDIEDIQVLNGAGAASLYGSDASNGALIITTKKGKRGSSIITAAHTTNIEEVSFLPQLQKRFGSGTGPDDVPSYTPYENQQYGPAFDGSMVTIGKPLVNGDIQTVQYSARDDKDKFWDAGVSNQTDFSISSGDEKSTYYVSGQYFTQKSTVPGDEYNRFSARINGERNLGNNVSFQFNFGYIQNRYDQSGAAGTTYDNVLQTPAHIPLLDYSDYVNNPFAHPDGYFNEYYANPYFSLANSRNKTRNDYLTGNIQLNYKPIPELNLMFRIPMSTRNVSSKSYTNKFTYSTYRKNLTSNFNNILGSVSDYSGYTTRINPEFQAQYIKNLSTDFSLNVILGASARDDIGKDVDVSGSNLVQAGLYNISNRLVAQPGASESNSRTRQMGVYADARLGFRNYLYLHLTGRNDWRSVLAKENRSFFYPSADISFIASDALDFLKNSKVINSLKLRAGASKVGLVNIGAYALTPTFSQGSGYPYNLYGGYTQGDRVVSPSIKPEITKGFEGGLDFEILQSRLTGSFTYYQTNTTDQTIPVNISNTTGFTSFLTNTGEVKNQGIETSLRGVALRKANGMEVTIGANYTYNNNEVLSLSDGLAQLPVTTVGNGGVYAVPGQSFPLLKGSTYNKDSQGRTIVDPVTGYPSISNEYSILGNTEPRHRLGLDATFAYKGFRLATLFEHRGGFIMYSAVGGGFDFSGAGIRTTYFNRERFVIPNSSYLDPATNTYVQNTSISVKNGGADFWSNGGSNTSNAENYTYSAAFWKLRELSLSYDVPTSVLGNLKYVKGARISVQGRNLFVWTPRTNIYTDPEYSAAGSDSNGIGLTTLGQTPPARFYGATLSLTF